MYYVNNMSSCLLQKEKEFYKLNEELEIRTKELMNEVDAVMKIQDNQHIITTQHINNSTSYKDVCQDDCNTKRLHGSIRERDTLTDNTTFKSDGDGETTCINDMGATGMSHFFRAKFKKVQNDYDKLHGEHKSKCEAFAKIQRENQKLSEEKDKWFHISAGHKTQINQLANQISVLNSKLQSKENENAALKKDIDQLRKDRKSENKTTSNLEVRLKKVTEESEKYKASYKNLKREEKDLRESHKKQIGEMSGIIKKIEKHKGEILNGFKKQVLLIDNIKKQKACIEQYKLCEKADNEFMKIIDWKVEN